MNKKIGILLLSQIIFLGKAENVSFDSQNDVKSALNDNESNAQKLSDTQSDPVENMSSSLGEDSLQNNLLSENFSNKIFSIL